MSLSGLNILLAEDNPTNQMVAVQMLESLGADVTLAVDGAEALEILERETFDAALIDIEMPRISGIDLIRHLRDSEGPVAGIPLIALTAYVMREHRTAIDEAGADGIIAKPILSIEKFGEEIQHFVSARQLAKTESQDATTDDASGETPSLDQAVFDQLFSSFEGPARAELVDKICTDIDDASKRIETAATDGNIEEIRAASHILISVAGAIGANKLQSLARCLNSAGHVSDKQAISRDGPELVAEAERIVGTVRSSGAE